MTQPVTKLRRLSAAPNAGTAAALAAILALGLVLRIVFWYGLVTVDPAAYADSAPNLVLQKVAEDLARALREDVFTDPQGRHVRAKYAARIVEDGILTTLWADHTFASPQHIALSLKQRRTQIVADCHKLKTDVDSFNENDNLGPKLQLSFDFTLDLEELDAADAA